MAEQPITLRPQDTPDERAAKLNELFKRLATDFRTDKARIGASGVWNNAEEITCTGLTIPTGAVAGHVATCDASGVLSWGEPPAGGSNPGGAAAELQYNNAGVLGGVTGSVFDGSTVTLPETLVDGHLTVSGELQGARDSRSFGDQSAAVTASKYLKMVNGVQCSATRGYPMARAGSIVDIALMCYVNSYTLGAEIRAVAKVNGSGSFYCANSPTAGAPHVAIASDTQDRGNTLFSANELIQVYLTISGTINIGYIEATVGLQYDT